MQTWLLERGCCSPAIPSGNRSCELDGSHGTTLGRVGALGNTVNSSLPVFLSSYHPFHFLYVKKAVFLLLFLQDAGGNQALTPCGWAPLRSIVSCRRREFNHGQMFCKISGAKSCWSHRQPQIFHSLIHLLWCKSAFVLGLQQMANSRD